jgi:hypothetical protein
MNRILNYPRSGSHYLQHLILNYSGNYIEFDHHLNNSDNDFIISIARDPFESIHSRSVMRKHYNGTVDAGIFIGDYVDTYSFLIENANLVIDYKDLISYPQELTVLVCSLLGFKKNIRNYPAQKDTPDVNYLVSSKTVQEYKEEYFNKKNLEECYSVYLELLSKSIKLN